MQDLLKRISLRTKIIIGIICLALIAGAVILLYLRDSGGDNIVTEDVSVRTSDISKSVTAAGEVVTADAEKISFSTSKAFKAMCVELNEKVSEGQHLILYSNGTYEDAPADGFITSINAPSTGYTAGSSNYIMLAYEDKLALDITVPEGEINEVSVGDKAEIVVNSDTSKVYTGKISKMKALSTTQMGTGQKSSQSSSRGGMSFGGGSSPFGSDSSTAYYTVTLTFDNDGTILPGMSAVCTVTISEKKDIMTVPIEAVSFSDTGEAYVKVVSGSSVREVPVTIGDSDADNVEITDGLEGNETVRIERKGKS